MKKLLLFFITALTSVVMMAETQEYTVWWTSSNAVDASGDVHWTYGKQTTQTFQEITWNASFVSASGSITASKTFVQVGSKKNPATLMKISTKGFTGKVIKGLYIDCYCMSNSGPTLTITAGTTEVLATTALTLSNSQKMGAACNVTLAEGDSILFEFNSDASAAMVFSKIYVEYEEPAVSGQVIYFHPNNTFADAGAKFALYYFGHATESPAFTDYMTLAENETDVYTATIPEGYTTMIVVRYDPSREDAIDWTNTWGQTVDITLEDGKDLYTINSDSRNGEGKWNDGSWSKYVYVEPCTPNYGFMVNGDYKAGTWKNETGEWMLKGLALESGDIVKLYSQCDETAFQAMDGNFNNYFDKDGNELEAQESGVYDLYITLNPGNDKLWVNFHPYETYVKVTEGLPFWTGHYIISWDDNKPHTVIDSKDFASAGSATAFTPGDQIHLTEENAVHISWNATADAYIVQLPNDKYLSLESKQCAESSTPENIYISWNATKGGVVMSANENLSASDAYVLFHQQSYFRAYQGKISDANYKLPTFYRLEDEDYECGNGRFGLEVDGTETINLVDAPDQALEEQGYRQYEVQGVTLTAGQTLKIRNLTCESRFIANIENGGASDSFEKNEDDISVTKSGKYNFYFKNKMGSDLLYIQEYAPEITYADSTYCVAGNFTNWKEEFKTLPAQVAFPKDSTLEFKQVLVRSILEDGVLIEKKDTLWFGQANEGSYMSRGNSAWTLIGEHNVLLTTDVAGNYGFSMDEHGHLVVTFPELSYDSTYYVAGNFTNWKQEFKALPAQVAFPKDSTLAFKQAIVRNILADGVPSGDKDTLWLGQANEGLYMSRGNSAWTLNGEHNVLLTTDVAGNYGFDMDEHGYFVVTFPVVTYDSTYYVAGTFTNWKENMQAMPYTLALNEGDEIEFKQVIVRQIYSDGEPVDADSLWFGQVNEGYAMTRESNMWTLDGSKNVLLTADITGNYTFSMAGSSFMVEFPALPVITYRDTVYNVAGDFTSWQLEALPYDAELNAESVVEFRQVLVRSMYSDDVFVRLDTIMPWSGAADVDNMMTRESSAWLLNGENNVRLTADIDGTYHFDFADGIFTVTYPALPVITYDTTAYVAGSFTDWQNDMQTLPHTAQMTKNQLVEFKYVRVITTYEGEGEDMVEVKRDTAWFGQLNDGEITRNDNAWTLDGDNNVRFMADVEGDYTFHLEDGIFVVDFPELIITNETISVIAGTFGDEEWVVDVNNKLPIQLNLTAEQNFLFKQVDIVSTLHNGEVVDTKEEWHGQVGEGTMSRNDNCWLLDGDNNVALDVDATGVYTFSLKENGELLVTYPALAPTGIDNNETEIETEKIIENGQLIIIRDGVRYNALGQVVE